MKKAFEEISKLNWIVAMLLFFLVLSWVIYQQWFMNLNHSLIPVSLAFDPSCDLRAGPCETILADGSSVSFAIQPRSIPISDQLTLEVIISGMTVDNVSVDINGTDMKMPPNFVNLKHTGNGHYSAKSALTFCTRSTMEWESVVHLDTGNKLIKIPYRFITSKQTY